MKIRHALLCGLLAAPVLTAQEEGQPEKPPSAEEAAALLTQTFREHGLTVDLKGGTIEVPCVIGRPRQALEYVLIHERGKDHEAMLVCKVPGSVLNGAFLALGYQKGQNARVVERDPLPTAEEVRNGAAWFDVIHPEGMKVWFTVRWTRVTDEGEKVPVEMPLEDLLVDDIARAPVTDAQWIYLGGHMAPLYRGDPPVFVADYEGNLIANVYKPQPNHLVTMKHERANDDMIWFPSSKIPMPETPVTLVIHKQETALHVARAKRLAEEKAKAVKEDGGEPAAADSPDRDGEKRR